MNKITIKFDRIKAKENTYLKNTTLQKAQGREINNVHLQLPPMKMPKNDKPDIVFSKRDSCSIRQPHENPLVIMLRVEEFNIYWVLIDNRSSADII